MRVIAQHAFICAYLDTEILKNRDFDRLFNAFTVLRVK